MMKFPAMKPAFNMPKLTSPGGLAANGGYLRRAIYGLPSTTWSQPPKSNIDTMKPPKGFPS